MHTYACQHCLTTGMGIDEAFLSISLSRRGQLVKVLITLEPHDILGSNFAYLFILTLSSHWYAKR